ncbi:MAG: AAA family ATPase [Campylobacteraceae bacterium]|nr:AAA family ATPase [Campylobacteraceae bacterium]MBT3883082.1 AAA family ATPase [Campylobacteraceae bacterium]MBT4030189.1 AAA family ATPase [Campylobacteraceae bacterium]MBT4178761.1 AAA family ATPase [Campylobacteraceae bacterium]MBT4572713.1 AAA family ATPase [Campylobacteraceae bacterium]
MKNNNIILIGFMGVGKGTVARALVKNSDYFAIDTDDIIESIENKKIKKIFEDNGEAYFRALEAKCAKWCESNITNTIISTGGGFYKQENINDIGTVIYLESSFDGILKRINDAPNAKAKLKKRPLLQDLKAAKQLYNQRIIDYKMCADVIVDVENKPLKKIVKEILKAAK